MSPFLLRLLTLSALSSCTTCCSVTENYFSKQWVCSEIVHSFSKINLHEIWYVKGNSLGVTTLPDDWFLKYPAKSQELPLILHWLPQDFWFLQVCSYTGKNTQGKDVVNWGGTKRCGGKKVPSHGLCIVGSLWGSKMRSSSALTLWKRAIPYTDKGKVQ